VAGVKTNLLHSDSKIYYSASEGPEPSYQTLWVLHAIFSCLLLFVCQAVYVFCWLVILFADKAQNGWIMASDISLYVWLGCNKKCDAGCDGTRHQYKSQQMFAKIISLLLLNLIMKKDYSGGQWGMCLIIFLTHLNLDTIIFLKYFKLVIKELLSISFNSTNSSGFNVLAYVFLYYPNWIHAGPSNSCQTLRLG